MKYKTKLIIAIIAITVMSIGIVNIVDFNKKDTIKGTINIWANENSYDYLKETAAKFVEINDKAVINVIKINSRYFDWSLLNLNFA